MTTWSNPAASGNGAMALRLHPRRLSRAVPEPRRWAAVANFEQN
jgi:hypothetical protein